MLRFCITNIFHQVRFEVKLTEELKWEDLIKPSERLASDDGLTKKEQTHKTTERSKSETKEDLSETDDAVPETKEITEETSTNGQNAREKESEKVDDDNKASEERMDDNKDTEVKSSDDNKVTEGKDADKDVEVETEQKRDIKDEEEAEEKMEMETEETNTKPEVEPEPIPTHLFRVGWSLSNTSLQLGEGEFSYAYESSGRFLTNKLFTSFGAPFSSGDVVGSYVSIDDENVSVTYTLNGTLQGTAITVPRSEFPEEGFALFPHILSRNYAFEVNYGLREEPWFKSPEELGEYKFLEQAEGKVKGPKRPETRGECEVVMMCGLPGAGKTHWVREFVRKNPEKRYTVIGNTQLLEKMTVSVARFSRLD